MRIIHVINTLGMGGAESLVCNLAQIQRRRGDDVSIVQIIQSKNHALYDRASSLGIPVTTLSKGKSVYNPLLIFRLKRYLKCADVIHSHLSGAQYLVAITKWLFRIKASIITTEHSTQNKRRNNKMFRALDLWMYKRYKFVVACADKALETFRKSYPLEKVQSVSIPNGIEVAKFHNAHGYSKEELLGVSKDVVTMTMVARYRYPKRQDVIVRSLPLLPDNVHAVLVGGNEKGDQGLEEVRRLADSIGVKERVHFLYARQDIPQVLKTSDYIIMSSEYEGLSLSSLEGMAAGIFIASDVNGLREIVKGAGLLFESGNEESLAGVINLLIESQQYQDDIRKKCYNRACEYDINNMAERYYEVYKQALEL